MGGAVYETAGRFTGYIKGPCISYDTTTQKLFTTPHNTGCANYADKFMIFVDLLDLFYDYPLDFGSIIHPQFFFRYMRYFDSVPPHGLLYFWT